MIGADVDVDRLAEALRVDGVVVDRLMGAGDAQGAHDRIAALVRETPFAVYVALVEQPAGLPSDAVGSAEVLAGLLSRRLGSGFYVVETTQGIQQVFSYGLDAEPAKLSLSAFANGDLLDDAVDSLAGEPVPTPATVLAEATVLTAEGLLAQGRGPYVPGGEYPATLTEADAERLAERAAELQATAGWRYSGSDYVPVRTASTGLSALIGGLVTLLVGLLLGQSLRGWPRGSRVAPGGASKPATGSLPDLEFERGKARKLVDALTRDLAATDWPRVEDAEIAGRALTARDAVEPLLESDEVADLVGAQVVARAGSRDLTRGARGAGGPLVTCFFDPRHGAGRASASWRLGDGEVEVPCCARCATRLEKGQAPGPLLLPDRRGVLVPYWDRRDVWARTGFGATTDFLARDVLADRADNR